MDDNADRMERLRVQRIRRSLAEAIKVPSEREQFITSIHYERDMNLKECQLHSQSIARLRAKMRAH